MEKKELVKPIRLLELFSGIGSPRAALRNLGIPYQSVGSVEIDPKAVKSYNAIFKNDYVEVPQDVSDWHFGVDVLVHGSPCQSYSIIGKQEGAEKGSGTQSSLMWETIRIIKEMGHLKPKVVIWENVKNVLSKKMKPYFEEYLKEMESLGYGNSYECLNARDFGLPQKRSRIYTISILGGIKFDFSKLERKEMRPLSEFLDERFELKHIVKAPWMLKTIKEGRTNFNGEVEILDEVGPANCILTAQDKCPNSGVIPLESGEYRILTERECWRLQGFSDEDYEAAESANPSRKGYRNSILYKQTGNSMAVPVLESIFKELKPYLVTQPYLLDCIGKKGIRRAEVITDCANTVTCRQDSSPAQIIEITDGSYRFLTERECWRLQGFSDKDYEAVESVHPTKEGFKNPTLYKQAGNAMAVPILEEIFDKLDLTEGKESEGDGGATN